MPMKDEWKSSRMESGLVFVVRTYITLLKSSADSSNILSEPASNRFSRSITRKYICSKLRQLGNVTISQRHTKVWSTSTLALCLFVGKWVFCLYMCEYLSLCVFKSMQACFWVLLLFFHVFLLSFTFRGGASLYYANSYGSAPGETFRDRITCTGREARLSECAFSSQTANCNPIQTLGVSCDTGRSSSLSLPMV